MIQIDDEIISTCNCLAPMEQLSMRKARFCSKCGKDETAFTHLMNQIKIHRQTPCLTKFNMTFLLLDGKKLN